MQLGGLDRQRSGSFLSRLERIVVPALAPESLRLRPLVDAAEDDGAEREIEAVVAAGDESRVAIAPVRALEPVDSATTDRTSKAVARVRDHEIEVARHPA